MKISKQINRTLDIEVVDTPFDDVKLMYVKWSDESKFVSAYVRESNVDETIKKMKQADIAPMTYLHPKALSKHFTATCVIAIKDDVDPSDYNKVYFDNHDMKEHLWTPTKFGESFPEDYTLFMMNTYSATSFFMDGSLVPSSHRFSVFGTSEVLKKIDNLAEKNDWLEIIKRGYYVPGNGDGYVVKVYLTADEEEMAFTSKYIHASSWYGICKIKGLDYDEYTELDDDW